VLILIPDSGGIVRALEMRGEQASAAGKTLPPLPVDVHPVRPLRRGLAAPPKFIAVTSFLADPTFEEMAAAGGVPCLSDTPHEIRSLSGEATGVGVSGEIPRVHAFERGLKGAITWMEEDGKGEWMTDEMITDERYVAVDVKGRGLVLFSACSHAGICNVISDATAKYNRPVHMVVGGLHLVPVEVQPVEETVDFLARRLQPPPDWVLPLHCTGMAPRAKLINAFGEKCVPAGVGMKVVVDGDEAKEPQLDDVEVTVRA
jgi:7,8-dihydropterin-6-yl-methyl-4-(beta-D-ribofuranosyl)aminobenzene 5'-phosphate synthase